MTQLAQTYLGVEPKAGESFQLIFGAQPFPSIHLRIQRQNSEFGGYWYISDEQEWG